MEKQRVLEVSAGILLVLVLILASVVIITASSGNETEITNSFNTYNYDINPHQNQYPTRTQFVSGKPYIIDTSYYHDEIDYYNHKTYYFDENRRHEHERNLRYDSFGNRETYTGIIGNKVNSYEVQVYNEEYVGGYFKTTFYFEDYYGKVNSQSVTRYIPAREKEGFTIKDISPSKYKNKRWWYKVDSLSKVD